MITYVLKYVCLWAKPDREYPQGEITSYVSGRKLTCFIFHFWNLFNIAISSAFIIWKKFHNNNVKHFIWDKIKLSSSPIKLCPDWNVSSQRNYKHKCEQLTLGG